MTLLLAATVGLLTAAGVWLLLRPRSFELVLGLSLLSYAVNLFIFAMGRPQPGCPPIVGAARCALDPLPQALVLTAIVIGLAMTGLVLALALRNRGADGDGHCDEDGA